MAIETPLTPDQRAVRRYAIFLSILTQTEDTRVDSPNEDIVGITSEIITQILSSRLSAGQVQGRIIDGLLSPEYGRIRKEDPLKMVDYIQTLHALLIESFNDAYSEMHRFITMAVSRWLVALTVEPELYKSFQSNLFIMLTSQRNIVQVSLPKVEFLAVPNANPVVTNTLTSNVTGTTLENINLWSPSTQTALAEVALNFPTKQGLPSGMGQTFAMKTQAVDLMLWVLYGDGDNNNVNLPSRFPRNPNAPVD